MPSRGVWSELRRRNVFKVAIAYLILSWLLIQVADVLFPALHLPDWSITLVVALLAISFPPALVFAWVYELTPQGLKRESEVDQPQSITAETGRRLNLITIGLVLAGICFVIGDHFWFGRASQLQPSTAKQIAEKASEPRLTVEDESVPFLAVLPFKATGSDDGGFLASGLHDDLLTRLAKLGVFKVISRTSMMEYSDTTKNMRQIGQELGVEYILEGSVQAIGNRVRINAQLIDARDDNHLWAETYDRELSATNLFQIQADLAKAISNELRATLGEYAQAVISELPTQNTSAYKAYLRGLQLKETGDGSISSFSETVSAFEQAVELDPRFAQAWAELSRARSYLASPWSTDDDEQLRQTALSALVRARDLRPGLIEAELAWITYLWIGMNDSQGALEAFEALGDRLDGDAEALKLKSSLYSATGHDRQAYLTLLAAQKIDPRSVSIAAGLTWLATLAAQCDAADEHAQSALNLAPDNNTVISTTAFYQWNCNDDLPKAMDLYQNTEFSTDWDLHTARQIAVAARDYERLLELASIPLPEDRVMNPAFDQIDKYIALHRLGRPSQARVALEQIRAELDTFAATNDPESTLWFARAKAWYYAFRGETELTKTWIEREKQHWRVVLRGEPNSMMSPWHARIFAIAGLETEAIMALRHACEKGNWTECRSSLSMPEFDILKGNPDYIDLQRQFDTGGSSL